MVGQLTLTQFVLVRIQFGHPKYLTTLIEAYIIHILFDAAPSSSGKRADFESVNLGSSPRGASKINAVVAQW